MRKILFDLFGVFMKVQSADGRAALENVIDLAGQEVSSEDFWTKYRDLRDQLDSGHWDYAEYLEMLGTELGMEFPDIDAFVVADYESWSEPSNTMVDFLRHLVRDGNEVGLLSNVPAALIHQLGQDQDWLTLFRPRIFSGVVGMIKPNREIFELASAIMETEPKDILFIDDTAANIDAARSLGFNAHHFRDESDAMTSVDVFLSGGDLPVEEQPLA